jgi:hypothetical protein
MRSTQDSGENAMPGHPDQVGHVLTGGYAGSVHYVNSVPPSGPLVRSAYLEQAKRIAPPQLLGRDDELKELAEFCTKPDGKAYVWWQAPTRAGKSALLAWFVLNPPPGVRVVSFFITSLYKGQDDRAAFTDAVMEQLADMLGQSMPAYLTETNRELHMLRMLAEAAQHCNESGSRLVLAVDGLDQDRGLSAGPDTYSIAGLLPARPAAGLRVIATGRPAWSLPADVPDDHPLRDPDIVRMLGGSQAHLPTANPTSAPSSASTAMVSDASYPQSSSPTQSSIPERSAGRVFVSYVRENSHNADRLQRILEAAGISVWRDTADLWPGENWRAKIRRAITDNTLVFIACFSTQSVARAKSYQNEELLLAIEQLRLRPHDHTWLIPVRFDDCDIPDLELGGGRTLTSIQRVDLFGDRHEVEVARLLATVLRLLEDA